MANPIIGNSLFALVLALMHAPPMFALLWTQRRLRRRMAVAGNPVRPLRDAPSSAPATSSLLAPFPGD